MAAAVRGRSLSRRTRAQTATASVSLLSVIDRRPYKKVARERAQQRTHDALLDAAEEELYRDEWQQTTLEALAAKAGVTKQTLLRHFGSKDGLLLQTVLRGATKVLEQRWSAAPGDVEAAVENLLEHYETWGERSLRIGAWQSGPAALAKLSMAARQVHYEWVDFAFGPQLERFAEPQRARIRAALIALCDVHAWWLLAHELGLERAELRATLSGAIERLLAEDR
jgi:AcrR family transcriptional regulator